MARTLGFRSILLKRSTTGDALIAKIVGGTGIYADAEFVGEDHIERILNNVYTACGVSTFNDLKATGRISWETPELEAEYELRDGKFPTRKFPIQYINFKRSLDGANLVADIKYKTETTPRTVVGEEQIRTQLTQVYTDTGKNNFSELDAAGVIHWENPTLQGEYEIRDGKFPQKRVPVKKIKLIELQCDSSDKKKIQTYVEYDTTPPTSDIFHDMTEINYYINKACADNGKTTFAELEAVGIAKWQDDKLKKRWEFINGRTLKAKDPKDVNFIPRAWNATKKGLKKVKNLAIVGGIILLAAVVGSYVLNDNININGKESKPRNIEDYNPDLDNSNDYNNGNYTGSNYNYDSNANVVRPTEYIDASTMHFGYLRANQLSTRDDFDVFETQLASDMSNGRQVTLTNVCSEDVISDMKVIEDAINECIANPASRDRLSSELGAFFTGNSNTVNGKSIKNIRNWTYIGDRFIVGTGIQTAGNLGVVTGDALAAIQNLQEGWSYYKTSVCGNIYN